MTAAEMMHVDVRDVMAREALVKEMEELTRQASDLQTRMDECTASKDLDGYAKIDSKRRAVEARMSAVKNQLALAARPMLTRGEVLSAWSSYASAYNKKVAPLIREYDAARKQLAEKYMKVVRMQSEAQRVRSQANALAKATRGMDPFFIADVIDDGIQPIDVLPNDVMVSMSGYGERISLANAFFVAHGDVPADAMTALQTVVKYGDSADL